jgi:aminopeptidase N
MFIFNIYKNDQFITQYLIPVMYDDGYPSSSHPVSATVVTPAEINTLFDSITYDKGSSLLRMLESTVSPSNFQSGLNVLFTN